MQSIHSDLRSEVNGVSGFKVLGFGLGWVFMVLEFGFSGNQQQGIYGAGIWASGRTRDCIVCKFPRKWWEFVVNIPAPWMVSGKITLWFGTWEGQQEICKVHFHIFQLDLTPTLEEWGRGVLADSLAWGEGLQDYQRRNHQSIALVSDAICSSNF